jgi:hypothetical protein
VDLLWLWDIHLLVSRPVATLRADLTSVSGWRMLRLLGERVVPSRQYMRALYPRWPRALLWLAYLDRLARGTPKWFRRPRPRSGAP